MFFHQDSSSQLPCIKQNTKLDTTAIASIAYTMNHLGQRTTITRNGLAHPAAPVETIGYDAKGQVLKTDTVTNTAYNRTYTYDGIGNRLTAWQTPPASASPQQHTTTAYIYNSWDPIAEYSGIDISSQLLNKTYLWGQDINGGAQSAGGVGGLLAVTEASTSHYPLYDGNGNITDYLDSTGTVVAHYQYDAYGNTIVKTGTKADAFSHRFSTKQRDTESGLYYYGYRYYDPVTGRWPSRDPIEENGGTNLYAFVGNDALNRPDILGLYSSRDEARQAAYDLVGKATAESRRLGYEEFAGDFNPETITMGVMLNLNANGSVPIAGTNLNHDSVNYRAYRQAMRGADGFLQYMGVDTEVNLIFGVEHSVSVFCCSENSEENRYMLGELIRGSLPTLNAYVDGTEGTVFGNREVPQGCKGGKLVDSVHSHNVGKGVVTAKGYQGMEVTAGGISGADQDYANDSGVPEHAVIETYTFDMNNFNQITNFSAYITSPTSLSGAAQ